MKFIMRRWLYSRHARSDSISSVFLVIGIECMEPVGIFFLKIPLEIQERPERTKRRRRKTERNDTRVEQ